LFPRLGDEQGGDMTGKLQNKKVAILVADGFEQVELTEPKEALEAEGAVTTIISPATGKVQAWKHDEKGDAFKVDVKLADANSSEYDALLLPGGVKNPDKLRMLPEAVQFAKDFINSGKPVAAICHGPWLLVEADVVEGRQMTSWPSLKTDLTNAGADWVDREVVVDSGLVTSRKPDDIPAFNQKMIEEFAEGKHREQAA